jgi:hypothetical protein
MTEPTETTITPKAPEITANIAAAVPVVINHVEVNVQQPVRAARTRSHQPAGHTPIVAPSKPPVGIPRSTAVATGQSGSNHDNGVTHHQDYEYGKERHTLTDRDGSTVTVVRDAENSNYRVTFDDKKAKFVTTSDEPGFTGTRRVPYGYGGVKSFKMEASTGSTFHGATLYCQDDVAPVRLVGILPTIDLDTITTNNKVIDTTTVQEIRSFLKRNPELGAELAKMNVPVTEVAGESQTVRDLGRFDPKIQACPRGKNDEYIVPRGK